MIIVAGTHRSGTSMWMQILRGAGLPVLGEAFPARMAGLKTINPKGFWETRLRNGVNFTTNPDPQTGIYLDPRDTRDMVLKVFAHALPRTEVAFLDRVVLTVRPWREHTRSVARLFAAEDEGLQASRTPEAAQKLAERAARREATPPVVQWWNALHGALADVAIRRYPHHIVPYTRLLRDPEARISAVIEWIGEGDLEGALAAVKPELRTFEQPQVTPPDGIDADMVAVFDAVFDVLDRGETLQVDLLREMNAVSRRLRERFPAPQSATAAR